MKIGSDANDIHPHTKAIAPTTVISSFAQAFCGQPWADFLFEHAVDVKVVSYYDPATTLHNINMQFYLPPEEETMYRLQFS